MKCLESDSLVSRGTARIYPMIPCRPCDLNRMPDTKETETKCACHVRGDFEIVYCPLHDAAPELLEALRASATFAHGRGSYHAGSFDYCTKRECIAAREAIRKAEGK